ncbi:MAG: SOS response-associated peptidase family protein [Candidatus Limnocylindrales bacterium]
MCGRFQQQRPTSELAKIFDAEDLTDQPEPKFNVAPTTEASVVVAREGRRAIVRYRWGLIPPWADDPRVAARTFNARAPRP